MGIRTPRRSWGSARATVRHRAAAAVFGDRFGLTIFLATLVVTALYWRVGVFINDNYTIANTLVNVAEGHLEVTHVRYGPASGATPGMKIHDGRLYGRNYGLVFLALPFLWGLQAVAAVADPRIAIAALWCLSLLALAGQIGTLVGRRRAFAYAGSLLALGAFAANVAVAHPLAARWLPLAALQISTMVWTGLLGVVVYRLVGRVVDRRVGTFAGVVTVVGTPVGFWASIPKRHVLIALLAMVAILAFHRSRVYPGREVAYRGLAYGAVAVSAWVFPLEPLLLLAVLAPVDLLTANSNAPRRLMFIGLAFVVALLPFLVTNALVTGHPLRPPGLLPQYSGAEQVLADGASTAGGSGEAGGAGDEGAPATSVSIVALLGAGIETVNRGLNRLWRGFISRGLVALFSDPERVYHTFIRSGYLPEVLDDHGSQAVTLALLETAPVFAAFVAWPIAVARSRWDSRRVRRWLSSATGQTDLIVGGYIVLIILTYLPRLPGHAQVTVRYLLPILPGLCYLLVRLSVVRHVVHEAAPTLALTTGAATAIGGQLVVLLLLVQSPTLGEAVQLHAWLGLGAAALVAAWASAATVDESVSPRLGAVCLGLATAATLVFLLLSGLSYFAYAGDFALPASQWFSDTVPLLSG